MRNEKEFPPQSVPQKNNIGDEIIYTFTTDITSLTRSSIPDDIDSLLNICRLYFQRGQYYFFSLHQREKAIGDFKLALLKLEQNKLLLTEKKIKESTHLRHLLLFNLAKVEYIFDNPSTAMKYCNEAIDLNYFSDQATLGIHDILLRGSLYWSQGKLTLAQQDFHLALKYQPNNTDALVHYAYLKLCQQQYDVAQKYFELPLEKDTPSEYVVFTKAAIPFMMLQGSLLCKIKQNPYASPETATAELKKIIFPTHGVRPHEKCLFYFWRAQVYQAYGEFTHAHQALEDCLKIDPHYRIATKLKAQLPASTALPPYQFTMEIFPPSPIIANRSTTNSTGTTQKKRKKSGRN